MPSKPSAPRLVSSEPRNRTKESKSLLSMKHLAGRYTD
jgi:hypothetical protein